MTAATVGYGHGHTFLPAMRRLLADPGMRSNLAMTLARMHAAGTIPAADVTPMLGELTRHLTQVVAEKLWLTLVVAVRAGSPAQQAAALHALLGGA